MEAAGDELAAWRAPVLRAPSGMSSVKSPRTWFCVLRSGKVPFDMADPVVVFDLDGTLVDSGQDIHDALRVALREVGAGRGSDREDEAAIEAGCHGLPLEVFF